MNERDRATFERFARRFAGVKREITDGPVAAPSARARAAGQRRAIRLSVAPVIAVVVLTAVALALAPLLAGAPQRSLGPSLPAVAVSSPAAFSSSAAPSLSASSAPSATRASNPPAPAMPCASLPPLDPASPPEIHARLVPYGDLDRGPSRPDSRRSRLVRVGRGDCEGDAIGAARWSTPDGHPPEHGGVSSNNLERFARIESENVARGEVLPIDTVSVHGGTIGCVTFLGWVTPIEAGSTFAFFLHKRGRDGACGTIDIWPVEGGMLVTPRDGTMPVATFLARATGSRQRGRRGLSLPRSPSDVES